MKKVLVVIHDLRIGGAQKSLVSFLQCLADFTEKSEYEVSLLVVDPQGAFMTQIPGEIRLLEPSKPLRWLGSGLSPKLLKHISWKAMTGEVKWLLGKKKNRAYNLQQRLWESWKSYVPQHPGHYDIAISYMDGVPNYYVMDKVSADRKILWVHSEYTKQGYHPGYDRPYFAAAEVVATISENCKKCLEGEFPQLREKFRVLENITLPRLVEERGAAGKCPEYGDFSGLRLLTVARLNPQKGIDIALQCAKLLKEADLPFLWLILGNGPQRSKLEEMLRTLELGENVRLLGSRENPYGYMAGCDILVQPSRVEGKSIVLDEAKVFCKPIVATAYTTVWDSLEDGKTGLITEMTPRGLADGILRLNGDPELRETLIDNLRKLPKGNVAEFQRYLEIVL